MGKSDPGDLRWRAVVGVYFDELDPIEVAEQLSMGTMQV